MEITEFYLLRNVKLIESARPFSSTHHRKRCWPSSHDRRGETRERRASFHAEMEPGTTANQQLEFELAVLRAVPGVLAVASYPKSGFKPKDLNANSVMLRLQTSDGGVRRIDKHCGADCASWFEAARDVKRQLSLHLGSSVVVAAEERVRLGLGAVPVVPEPQPAELTEEDMEWLATWFDGLPDPSKATAEQAIAALTAHRAGSRDVGAALTEAQLVRARFRAAELRIKKATAERERLRELIPEEQPKRQRAAEHPEGEYWHEWELPMFRQLEKKAHRYLVCIVYAHKKHLRDCIQLH